VIAAPTPWLFFRFSVEEPMKSFFVFPFLALFLLLTVLAQAPLKAEDMMPVPPSGAASAAELPKGWQRGTLTEIQKGFVIVDGREIPISRHAKFLDLSGEPIKNPKTLFMATRSARIRYRLFSGVVQEIVLEGRQLRH